MGARSKTPPHAGAVLPTDLALIDHTASIIGAERPEEEGDMAVVAEAAAAAAGEEEDMGIMKQMQAPLIKVPLKPTWEVTIITTRRPRKRLSIRMATSVLRCLVNMAPPQILLVA